MIGNNDRSCAVIIVAYNNENSIGDCLDSVFAHSRPETAAVVVDNSPGDATSAAVERRRSACPDREIVLVRRPDNIGFAAGCNLGARGRTETHLLFLNPDAKLENDVIALLTAFLQANPRAKIAGPQIRSDDGQIVKTCRNLPTPFGILCDATGLDSLLGKSRLARFDHAAARTVDQIIGACMLIRRDDFEILGGFDERFFIYYEEVDLCKRVVDAGGEVWFRPEARVTHLGGASCESPSAVDRMPGYLRRSRSQYFAKHFGLAPQFLVLGITLLECACKAMVLSIPSGNETADAAVVRFSRRNGFVAVLTEWRRRGNAGKESDS